MFLLVLLHGTYFVLQDPAHRWPVLDPSVGDDPTYGILLNISSGFLRPTFFLISGLFSALLWQIRGLRGLGMHRLKRLGVPFVFGCVIIIPLTGLAMVLTSGTVRLPVLVSPLFLSLGLDAPLVSLVSPAICRPLHSSGTAGAAVPQSGSLVGGHSAFSGAVPGDERTRFRAGHCQNAASGTCTVFSITPASSFSEHFSIKEAYQCAAGG